MKDSQVFEGKNLTDLLKDIHDSTLNKRETIIDLIGELRRMITDKNDAVILAPIIKDYIDVMVRSDDHLVKIATIVQRIIAVEYNNKTGDIEGLLSDAEKDALLSDAVNDLKEEVAKLDTTNATPTPAAPTILASVTGSL